MSRSEISTEFNTFVGGILTEANPINFPPGFSLDEQNFILQRDGTRRRRRGLGEVSTATDAVRAGSTPDVSEVLLWKNGYTDTAGVKFDVLVASSRSTLSATRWTLTAYLLTDPADIFGNPAAWAGTFGDIEEAPRISFHDDVLIYTYLDNTTKSLPVTGALAARDVYKTSFFKIEGGVLDRPSSFVGDLVNARDFQRITPGDYKDRDSGATIGDEHGYDLLASGWTKTNLDQFKTDTTTFPGLSDNMNTGLEPVTGVFTSSWVDLANNGTGLIPGGGEIIGLGSINYDRANIYETAFAVAVTDIPTTNNIAYQLDTVSHAGRGFHLMYVPGSDFGDYLLAFTGIVTDPEDLRQCLQANDPTARDFNQLLETDGGILDISDAGIIDSMILLNNRILIFGSNGVFEVFSRDNLFTPAGVAFRKITETRSIGKPVIAEDAVYFLSNSGVYMVAYNPSSSEFQAVNITAQSIQTLINKIPFTVKGTVKTIYVDTDATVRFLFDTRVTDGVLTELIYDSVLKAWSKNVYSGNHIDDLIILDYLLLTGFDEDDLNYPTDSRLHIITLDAINDTGSTLNYLKAWKFNQTDFVDKLPIPSDETEYLETPAFLQTGYLNANDSSKFKQGTYIVPSFLRTEDGFTDDGSGNLTANNESSCVISSWWDFAEDSTDTKVNPPFEAYRLNKVYIPTGPADTFDYGQSVITTKNRLTGRGRALSLRFESSVGKDCRLLGWNLGFGAVGKV